MEIQFGINNNKTTNNPIPLKLLVEQLALQFQLPALRNGSTILNDVAEDLYVHADKNILAKIISSLLDSVTDSSRNSYIRISAKRYNNIVLFHLRDSNTSCTQTKNYDWEEMNLLAGKLGGCIIEDEIKKKHATITFSFCSMANAA
jgi:hypothetical protein